MGSWMDMITIYVVPFRSRALRDHVYWALGINRIGEELNTGRKSRLGKLFCFAAKYIYVGLCRPGVYYEHCIQRKWIRRLEETPEPAFAGTGAFLFELILQLLSALQFYCLISYRKFCLRHLPDLGRCRRSHLTGGRDGRHRSECPDGFCEGVPDLPERR